MLDPENERPKFENALQRLIRGYNDTPTEEIIHALDACVLMLEERIEQEK